MRSKHPPVGFPAWAAPGMGLFLGAFLGYCALLQNDPLSPLSPLATVAVGALIGALAGVLLGLRERFRH